MSETTQLSNLKKQPAHEAFMPQVQAGFFNLQSFELIQRIAKGFSASTLVPKEYQNNIGNCMIALNLAQRIGGDPLMVMQNLIVIHGRPTWSAQYLIATANMCGRFTAIRFEFFGDQNADSWGCRAWAIENTTGEKLVGSDVTIAIAKKEGWYGKNGSKWQSIPQQMLMYRAGSWWVRAYAPELSMGLMTTDEVIDTFDAKKDASGNYSVDVDSLKAEKPKSEVIEADHVDTSTGEIVSEKPTDPKQIEQDKPDIKADEIQSQGFVPTPEEQAEIQQQLIKEAEDEKKATSSKKNFNIE